MAQHVINKFVRGQLPPKWHQLPSCDQHLLIMLSLVLSIFTSVHQSLDQLILYEIRIEQSAQVQLHTPDVVILDEQVLLSCAVLGELYVRLSFVQKKSLLPTEEGVGKTGVALWACSKVLLGAGSSGT